MPLADPTRAEAIVRMWDALADAGTEPHRVAEVAAGALQEVLGGGVAVFLVDVDGAEPGRLTLAAVRHETPEIAAELSRVLSFTTTTMDQEGYLAQARRRGGPLVVDNPWGMAGVELPEYLPWLRDHPLSTLLVVPLAPDGRLLGFLVAGRHEPGATYTDVEVRFAEEAGRRVGLVMANAQLAAVQRARTRLERAVADVSRACEEALGRAEDVLAVAAAAVGRHLGTGGCALWLIDEASAELLGRSTFVHPDPQVAALVGPRLRELAALAGPFTRQVLREGSALLSADETLRQIAEQSGVGEVGERFAHASVYARRLDARGAPVAVLAVSCEGGDFPPDDRKVVDAVAERVALALDNATLLATARSAQQQQRALVQHTADLLVLVDRGSVVRYASPAAERLLGATLNRSFFDRVVESDRDATWARWQEAVARRGTHELEFRWLDGTGRELRLHALVNNLLDDPAVDGVVLTVRDVTAEREAAERLAERAAQQAALASIAAAVLTRPVDELPQLVAQRLGDNLQVSDVLVAQLTPSRTWRVLGSTSPLVGTGAEVPTAPGSGYELMLDTGEPVVVDDYRRADSAGQRLVFERYGTVSGATVPIVVAGEIWGCLGAYGREHRPFTPVEVAFLQTANALLAGAVERANRAERLLHQARHDPVTALPNRAELLDHLRHALGAAEPDNVSVALLLLDLDDFKAVNDALGHVTGDRALADLGRRLAGLGAPGDAVARLGGDEFALCLTGRGVDVRALEVADAVLATVREPVELPELEVAMSGSVGVALAPAHGSDPDALLQAADMAMYRAKADRSGWALYDPNLDGARSERLAVLTHLRRGLASRDLELHYQPLVDLRSSEVVEVEALVRWRHPTRGLLGPDTFVPFAEQTELVHDLTRYTVRRATEQARAWRAAGWTGTVAVNVSPVALRRPAFVRELQEELAEADGGVSVEITESALVDERARDAVRALADAGVRCSVDDFGTGYSSLAYLRTLPVTRLKLDRAFNRRVDRDDRDAAIVGGVVDLAHSIGLDVVAEGIETSAVSRRLAELDVDVGQGWLYGQAEPPGELQLLG